jgi:Flp pilus assembly protein TadG
VLTARPSRTDGGSVLLLMPVAVLVVLVLAAITVDLGAVHLARKELVDAAAAAANDATTYGLSEAALRTDGSLVLDRQRAQIAIHQSLAARRVLDHLSGAPEVAIDDDARVTVHLTREVDYVFARALPGNRSATVTARATAVAQLR